MTRGSKGFTLLEVMVAVAIIAIILVMLVGAISNYAIKQQHLTQRTVAGWVADNLMLETRLQSALPTIGEKSDKVEMAKQTWYWRQTVSNTEDTSMRRVEIQVREKADDEKPLVTLIGFVGQK